MDELARVIQDYRDLGVAVVTHQLDKALQQHMVSAVSDYTAGMVTRGEWEATSSLAHTRVVAGSPPNRWASHTGMIATRVRAAATTLMTGA